jgi:hypothetical protein
MTHSAVDLSPTDTFELSAASVRDLLVSRESAVRRIFTGGALTLLAGPTLFFAGFLVDTNLQPLGVFAMLASIALAGTGLALIGLAAKHLLRFGGPLGSMLLTALGGFGASVLALLSSMVLQGFVSAGTALETLSNLAGMGLLFFTVMFVLVVIGGLMRWAVGVPGKSES